MEQHVPQQACRRPALAPDVVKVAVCIVGFARTLGSRAVYQSISDSFRDTQLARFDVFGVISLGDQEQDTGRGQRSPVSAASIHRARSVLHAVGWDEASRRQPGPRSCSDPCMAQFERLEQCGALLAAEERRCGRDYDYVAKLRTDTIVSGSITSWSQLNRSILWRDRWVGDSLVILPRRNFDPIARQLGSGNRRPFVALNLSRSRASQPSSCWGVCSPAIMCRCANVLSYVSQKSGLTPRYHTLRTDVHRTIDAQMAYSSRHGVVVKPPV